MKRQAAQTIFTTLLLLWVGSHVAAQTPQPAPIPNDPACLDVNRSKWLDIINARATLQRIFGPTPPPALTPEVVILFVDTPIKVHADMEPHVRRDLEINLNEDGSRPDDSHATSVASPAIAKTQNAFGVCSVAGDGGVKAASAIIVDSSGLYGIERARQAMRYAIDQKKAGHPIEIVAAAFGGGDDPQLTEPVIKEMDDNGIILVAAAGTQVLPRNLDQDPIYPAAYSRKFKNVVTVTALNSGGTALDKTANWGPRTVQLAAAGQVTVVSFLDPANGGGGAAGSSIGVGQVAGALALIKRYKERDHRKAVERLLLTATPLQGIGAGKLDVDRAFTARIGCQPPSDTPELLIADGSERAVALDSASLTPEPFAITNSQNLSSDKRTRLMLFARDLQASDNASNLVATAQDSQGQIHQLTVEFVGKAPQTDCLMQVNVLLPSNFPAGTARLSLSARGKMSNVGVVTIQ